MKVFFETERLIIRNLVPDDYEDAFKWCGDPEVNKYLIYPLYSNALDVKKWIEGKNIDDPDNYDFGFVLKETGKLIGCGGLAYNKEEETWIIGYNITKDTWGHGYVVEALQGIINYINKTRKVKVIRGTFAIENYRSKRVMEKLGMTYCYDSEYEKFDGSAKFKALVYEKRYDE